MREAKMQRKFWRWAALPLMGLFVPALVLVTGGCGSFAAKLQTGLPQAQPTVIGPLSGPVPPTFTPVMPPGYKSPTPIPPEHRAYIVAMGADNHFGRPAIHPRLPTPGSTALPISEQDVKQYVEAHSADKRRSGAIPDGDLQLLGVEQTQLVEVYRRYMPVVLTFDQ